MIRLAFVIVIISLFLPEVAHPQPTKNPKVAEVEAHLTQKTVSFVKNRFPDVPILVNLTVTPLRRSQNELNPTATTEELPYYSIGFGDSILDEWDDPSKSIHDLIPRIQSVSLQITMPQYVSDDELFELRDALYSNLNIIPGRDKIEFVRKNWQKDRALSNDWIIFLSSLIGVIFILSFFSLRYFVTRLGEGLAKGGGDKPVASAPAPMPQQNLSQNNDKRPAGLSEGNMQFNDTMRVEEKIVSILERLNKDPCFPTLEDMIDMETEVKKDLGFLGTILQEMPKDVQKKVFARSSDPRWLEAFYEQAPTSIEHYHFVNKLAYRKREEQNIKWEELLICLWRLGDELKPFIRELEQRDALGILAWMPTTISVPTARETFPGGWGILLRHDFKPPPLPDAICEEMIKTCKGLKPYNKMMMLERFQHERGLLRYLRECNLDEERDIYKASKPDASIHVVRPPFYPIFEAEEALTKRLAEGIAPRDWGVALFNVDRGLRGKITKFLNDNENYILIETLKACDQQGIQSNEIWAMREKIAKVFYNLNKAAEEEAAEPAPSPQQAKKPNTDKGSGPKVA